MPSFINCKDPKGSYLPLIEMTSQRSRPDRLVNSLDRMTKVDNSSVSFQEWNCNFAFCFQFFFFCFSTGQHKPASPEPAAKSSAYESPGFFFFLFFKIMSSADIKNICYKVPMFGKKQKLTLSCLRNRLSLYT